MPLKRLDPTTEGCLHLHNGVCCSLQYVLVRPCLVVTHDDYTLDADGDRLLQFDQPRAGKVRYAHHRRARQKLLMIKMDQCRTKFHNTLPSAHPAESDIHARASRILCRSIPLHHQRMQRSHPHARCRILRAASIPTHARYRATLHMPHGRIPRADASGSSMHVSVALKF